MTDLQTAVTDPEVPALVPRRDDAQPHPQPADQPVQGPSTAPSRAGTKVDLGLIRLARAEDYDDIMHLCQMMHAETGIYEFNREKVHNVLVNTITGELGLVGLINADEKPVGIVILALNSAWYSTEKHLAEMMFFVHPDYRRSNYAKTLIGWAKHVSDKMGMVLSLAIYNDVRTKAKVGLCGRLLESAGVLFIHNKQLASMKRVET